MSDTDDLIRRAEAWLSKLPRPVQYAEAVAVLTESPDLVRELLAAVKGPPRTTGRAGRRRPGAGACPHG